MADRPWDVVVYGATGFTGRLVVEYYAQHATCRWAVAGRSESKLRSILETHAGEMVSGKSTDEIGVIVASADDPNSLRALAESTRVVLATVGPFTTYGTPMVQACVEAGTGYVDTTGEIGWVKSLVDRFHGPAAQAGVRIVPMCGMEAIPSDVGAYVAHQRAVERGLTGIQVSGYVERLRMVPSGGTAASIFAAVGDPATRASIMDMYYLNPPAVKPKLVGDWDHKGLWYDRTLRGWVVPFLGGAPDARLVRRTAALMGGDPWSYREGFAPGGMLKGSLMLVGQIILFILILLPPTRYLLRRLAPTPGTGPSPTLRKQGYMDMKFHAVGTGDKTTTGEPPVTCRVRIPGDPAYDYTARMVGEAALCLALDPPPPGSVCGVVTPVAAMGDALVVRLKAAGIQVE